MALALCWPLYRTIHESRQPRFQQINQRLVNAERLFGNPVQNIHPSISSCVAKRRYRTGNCRKLSTWPVLGRGPEPMAHNRST